MSAENTVKRWVNSLYDALPHVPERLDVEFEKDRLRKLDRWLGHVQDMRRIYDTMDRSILPDDLKEEGKRQVVPVLLSLESMTEDEAQAWNELFTGLAGMQAMIALNYYQSRAATSVSMSLEDILNYLPVVFLYVLSSYNPYPGREEHDEDFSHDDGRVRLSTWVHIDMKRHIDSYLRQHAYAVKPGSTEMQRLHQRIVEKREELAALNGGRQPTREQIAEAMDESISPSEYAAIMNNDVLSLDTKCRKQDEDEETTHADMLEARPDNVERSYNPRIYLKKRASTPELKEAVDKILYSDESLTSEEKSQLGT